MIKKKHLPRILTLFILCLFYNTLLIAQETVSFTVTNGPEIRCAEDSVLEITISPNLSDTYTLIHVVWGDGEINTINPGESLDLTHTFNTTPFWIECQDYACAINPLINGFCFNISVTAQYTNIPDENNAKIITYKIPPESNFEISNSTVCVGGEVCFTNRTCPSNDEDMVYEWDFGNGVVSNAVDTCIVYSSSGTYPVELFAENICGDDLAIQTVTVVDPAVANVTFVETGTSNSDTLACSPHNVTFTNNSMNGTGYEWVITHNGSEVFDSIASTTTPLEYEFDQPGTYIVSMEVLSICGNETWQQLFTINEGPAVTLDLSAPTCETFFYTPDVTYTGGAIDAITWTFEGGIPSTSNDQFPTDIEFPSPGSHPITLTVSSACGTQVAVDTFVILELDTAQIAFGDTTICSLDGDIIFSGTPEEAIWEINGNEFNGTINPELYDAGTYQITLGAPPCIISDTVLLTIETGNITMPQDQELCIDDAPFSFTASPPGGTWHDDEGVIGSNGIFDPAISGLGNFTIYYSVENLELPSCSNVDSFQVTVSQLQVDFVVDTCYSTTLCFDTINTSSFTSIMWDFDGTGTSNQVMPCHNFPVAGSYDVTAEISHGACDASITKTVSIEDPPVSNFNLLYNNDLCSPLEVAFENLSVGSNLLYDWQVNGETFSTSENPENMILESFTQDSLIEFSLTVSNDCASSLWTESVVVKPRPFSLFSTHEDQYCSGDTIPMSNVSEGNPLSYEWFLNGELISTDSIEPVISYITEIVDTIEICLVTTNDCGQDTLCLDVEILPTDVSAFFHTTPNPVCEGDTIWFSNFATQGVPVFYDFGDGNSTSISSPFYIYENPGIYTVTQQAFGCGYDSYENEIEVLEAPVASWESPEFGCPGDVLTFQNTSENVMSYQWDFGDGTENSQEESPVHQFHTPGFYEVCLTVYVDNFTGCSNTNCQIVQIFNPPVADFMAMDSVCLGDATLFESIASADVVYCEYDFGDGNFLTECDPSHIYQAPGVYVVTQVVENQNFCRDTISKQVFIREIPSPEFTFEFMNGCHPDSVQFTNLSELADSYSWDFGDNTTSVLTHPIHYYENPGTYTVTLTAYIDGICSNTYTQEITIDETPVAIFQPDTPGECAGLEVIFNNYSTGTYDQVIWSFGDGFYSYENTPVHTFNDPGMVTIQLIVKNEELCADTTSLQMEIYQALALTAEQEDIDCFGEATGSIDLNFEEGTLPLNFSWNNGLEEEDPDELVAGNYSVTVTDMNNCEWIESFQLTEPSPITLEVDQSIVTCFGGSDGSITVNTMGGVAPYEYEWETGDMGSEIQNLSADTYELTITDANNCIFQTGLSLPENQPIEYLDSIRHISCFGENDGVITLDSIWGGYAPYTLQVESDDYEAGGISITRFDSLSPNVYSIEIEDANGCMEIYETELLEPDPVSVNIDPDSVTINIGESVPLNTFYNAENPAFYWSPSKGLDCIDCPNPNASPFISRLYNVLMVDENLCEATDSVFVFVKNTKDIFLPNVFTPNGDLRNDVFRVRAKVEESIYQITVFRIFDRWGEMMFEASNFPPNNREYGWDGTFRGEKVEPGTYVYYLKVEFIDGEEEERTGEVLLIR